MQAEKSRKIESMFYVKSIEGRGYINSTSFMFYVAALKTNLKMTDFQRESPSFAVHQQLEVAS